ncbi:siderophore biosynthesis protein [Tolypothrix sp. VBCCA 56010]|uniref:siderophore biosynthesis protein n=1 Tax=Tolypothrix sp. VBCCA 56010 TaxID=3137731 RepID=UPI003D7E9C40
MKIETGNLDDAVIELKTATELIIASAKAMEVTGSLTKQQYEEQIRPMMIPPHLKSDNFSGIMLWDRAYLISILKKMSLVFKTLPASLQSQHEEFISALMVLFTAHKAICQKFVGDDSGSLRNSKFLAVNILNKFEQNRLQLISPNHKLAVKCPFHEDN